MDPQQDHSISLNKFISSTGICSRREADKWIEAGRVVINGQVAQKGNRVLEGDIVMLDGKPLRSKPRPIYLAFNKPVGIVCTTDLNEPQNIISFIDYPERLFPIGRLDKMSQGLIFLTNDGDMVNKILRAGNNHEKEYLVEVGTEITPAFLKSMRNGIPILGTVTRKCKVTQTGPQSFQIVLTQGLNRQIRRMCEYLGYEVKRLKRVRIMHVALGNLALGKWRELTKGEINLIQQMVADSSKTEEASVDKNKGMVRRSKKNFRK